MAIPLSMTTDYVTSLGDPGPYLRRIAEAGFSWLHWCHEWNTDFLYDGQELARLDGLLRGLRLGVHDIHGSAGKARFWGSPDEAVRQAGIELIRNRVEMAARWACPVVIMHAPKEPPPEAATEAHAAAENTAYWARFRGTLDALEPICKTHGVRLALENMAGDNFDTLDRVFRDYPPAFVGLCYDPGHGNIAGNGLDRLERVRERLIALHLNDNDGSGDQHRPVFAGTVDWPRLAGIIARSGYKRECLGTEVVIKNSGNADEMEFLRVVAETGGRFAGMVEGERRMGSRG